MKIAVTYENGNVFQHFGRTEFFKVYEVENNKVISSEVIGSNGTGHGALAGLLAGTLLGALIAALTCASRWADVLLSPAVRVIRAVPVVSFILFVLLWTRRGLVPVVVSALMVLPVVWGNVSRGIRETDPRLLEQAGALRFSRLKTVRLVYLPSVRPYFLSAVVTSLGLAWKSGVAAEVLCRPAWAVGTQIVQARDYLETPSLFAWTLVVLLLSLALEKLLSALLNRINRRWSP